jgi:hypothetical protein
MLWARRIVHFMDSQHWSADNPMADSIRHLGINADLMSLTNMARQETWKKGWVPTFELWE